MDKVQKPSSSELLLAHAKKIFGLKIKDIKE
jgi:hypothetical protein